MEGTLIKQKEICQWCGKEFITFGTKKTDEVTAWKV